VKDYDEECLISASLPLDECIGMTITTCKENKYIKFKVGAGLSKILSNSLKTDNGLTVGERHRAYLHEKLDALIDHHLNISQEK
jgi:hypothetical protein